MRIFDYHADIDLVQISTGIAPNHDGDPLGSILGQWVPIESKKQVKAVKFNMPQDSNFQLPRVIDSGQNSTLRSWRQITVGATLGSILGPMGSHWVKKWVKTVKNYHAPKFELSTTPRSSISTNLRLYGYGAKSR